MTHILIHVPTINGQISAETTSLLLGLQQVCHENDIICTINISNTLLNYWDSRNHIIKTFKDTKNFTHLLFIGYGICTNPNILMHLIKSDKPVSCLIAPMGNIRWDNLLNTKNVEAINTILNDKNKNKNNISKFWTWIHANINMYHTIFSKDTKVNDGWINIDAVGADFLLLKREVVLKLQDNTFKPELNCIMPDKSLNDYLKELNYTIWAYPTAIISKTDKFQYIGQINDVLLSKLKLDDDKPIQKIQKVIDDLEYQPPID